MVFLFVFVILFIFLILLLYSRVQLRVINLKYSTVNKEHINEDFILKITLYILKIIPIFNINITKIKLDKIKDDNNFKRIKESFLKYNKNNIKKSLSLTQNIKIYIKKFNLTVIAGVQDAFATSFVVPIISGVIMLFLKKYDFNSNNFFFNVQPIYRK